MTREQANIDTHFEKARSSYILKTTDRMRRIDVETESPWFAVMGFDVGRKAAYFCNGRYEVQKRKDDAPALLINSFDEWFQQKVGISLEEAKRQGVTDLSLLEEAWNFKPN
jgi:hypothetical protein